MRVLIVASLASSLVRFRGSLIESLLISGHQVVTCAPEPDAETVYALAKIGVGCVPVEMSRAGTNPLADYSYMRHLRHIIERECPDVVLAYTPKPVIYSGFACAGFARVRHVALVSGLGYGFGHETFKQRMLGRVLTYLFKAGLRKSAAVIFQNADDRALFIENGIVSSDRALLVDGSGVDTAHFSKQELPEGPVFLLMARLIPEKGIREYVDAARALRTEFPKARWLLAGWIENRKSAISRRELAQWQAEKTIEYLGELGDVRPAIAQSSIYVLPSYYREGIPRSILEAMSMGRAVITTDTPGCRETVSHGKNGFLVPPRDTDALISSMRRLAGDSMLVRQMARESRLIVENRFAVERVNRQMLAAMGLAA